MKNLLKILKLRKTFALRFLACAHLSAHKLGAELLFSQEKMMLHYRLLLYTTQGKNEVSRGREANVTGLNMKIKGRGLFLFPPRATVRVTACLEDNYLIL